MLFLVLERTLISKATIQRSQRMLGVFLKLQRGSRITFKHLFFVSVVLCRRITFIISRMKLSHALKLLSLHDKQRGSTVSCIFSDRCRICSYDLTARWFLWQYVVYYYQGHPMYVGRPVCFARVLYFWHL